MNHRLTLTLIFLILASGCTKLQTETEPTTKFRIVFNEELGIPYAGVVVIPLDLSSATKSVNGSSVYGYLVDDYIYSEITKRACEGLEDWSNKVPSNGIPIGLLPPFESRNYPHKSIEVIDKADIQEITIELPCISETELNENQPYSPSELFCVGFYNEKHRWKWIRINSTKVIEESEIGLNFGEQFTKCSARLVVNKSDVEFIAIHSTPQSFLVSEISFEATRSFSP